LPPQVAIILQELSTFYLRSGRYKSLSADNYISLTLEISQLIINPFVRVNR
jgi:hypothetical protein